MRVLRFQGYAPPLRSLRSRAPPFASQKGEGLVRGVAAASGASLRKLLVSSESSSVADVAGPARPGARVESASRAPSLGSPPRVRAPAFPRGEAGEVCSGRGKASSRP